ncbi:MAG: hypothetical protein VW934_11780 [Alphaproteobacteria bacterium]
MTGAVSGHVTAQDGHGISPSGKAGILALQSALSLSAVIAASLSKISGRPKFTST